jgi:hypothetical protein
MQEPKGLSPAKKRLDCPNCGSDLRTQVFKSPIQCPSCGEQLRFPLSHRLAMALGGLFLSLVIPAELGLTGPLLLCTSVICVIPAAALVHGLLIFICSWRFERDDSNMTTLFRR